jgi:vacuolar iron transporter family protein
MPSTEHVEKHFTSSAVVRDIVIGISDGLTVPFALAAGLSGAVASTAIVVTAGFAEIAAGSIAMGLGGYLAAKTEEQHYDSELKREYQEVKDLPNIEEKEVAKIFEDYGLNDKEIFPIVDAFKSDHKKWVDFMMRFELGLDKPDPLRARKSAFTIALAYIFGGIIPLAPYIFETNIKTALLFSVFLTLIALIIFGIIKGKFTGLKPIKSGIQTAVIGGLAAAAAFIIAKFIS